MLGGSVVLHSRGLINGDLHFENALFPLQASQANSKFKNGLFTPKDPEDDRIAGKVRRTDGKDLNEHVSRYFIAQDELLMPYTALASDQLRPKLIDVKGPAPVTSLYEKTYLRSPELALEDKASQPQDIWAFGCAIFEVLTGFDLFPLYNSHHRRRETEVDDLMLRFLETLGPLTPAMKTKLKRHSLYFDDQGRRTERMPEDDTKNAASKNHSGSGSDVASSNASSVVMVSVDSAALKADLKLALLMLPQSTNFWPKKVRKPSHLFWRILSTASSRLI